MTATFPIPYHPTSVLIPTLVLHMSINPLQVVAPRAAQQVLDAAIQLHGGAGVHSDLPLSRLWAAARTLRIADGPDEVHLMSLGRAEVKKHVGGGSAGRLAARL